METAFVQEAAAAALRGETVIDVRTAAEYAGGHAPIYAVNVHGGMATWRAAGLPVEAGTLDRVGS